MLTRLCLLAFVFLVSITASTPVWSQDAGVPNAPPLEVAVGGAYRVELALKVSVGKHDFAMAPVIVTKNDAAGTISVGDENDPVKCSITVQPTAMSDNTGVRLQIKVEVHAGTDTLTRNIDMTTPLNASNAVQDAGNNQKFELRWVVKAQ